MPHEISTGSHWPRPAAIAAVAAVATGAIDGAALRLADRWYRHLAERRVAVPRERDFAAFGGVSKLERLRRALAPIAPRDLPPILPALKAKRSEAWRKTKAARPRPRPELRRRVRAARRRSSRCRSGIFRSPGCALSKRCGALGRHSIPAG